MSGFRAGRVSTHRQPAMAAVVSPNRSRSHAEPAELLDAAVDHRREPALGDPRLAGRRERVRVLVGDPVAAQMSRPVARWVRKLLSNSTPQPGSSPRATTSHPNAATSSNGGGFGRRLRRFAAGSVAAWRASAQA